VIEASRALERGDLVTLGELMAASHESMRHDFEITVPAIDQLVALLQSAIGTRGGARMTGGGFGGCTVTLAATDHVAAIGDRLAREYQGRHGRALTWFVSRPARGAHLVST